MEWQDKLRWLRLAATMFILRLLMYDEDVALAGMGKQMRVPARVSVKGKTQKNA